MLADFLNISERSGKLWKRKILNVHLRLFSCYLVLSVWFSNWWKIEMFSIVQLLWLSMNIFQKSLLEAKGWRIFQANKSLTSCLLSKWSQWTKLWDNVLEMSALTFHKHFLSLIVEGIVFFWIFVPSSTDFITLLQLCTPHRISRAFELWKLECKFLLEIQWNEIVFRRATATSFLLNTRPKTLKYHVNSLKWN